VRPNDDFVFYAERMDAMWIMPSEEADQEAVRIKTDMSEMENTAMSLASRTWRGFSPG
jgi:hypothetical protein